MRGKETGLHHTIAYARPRLASHGAVLQLLHCRTHRDCGGYDLSAISGSIHVAHCRSTMSMIACDRQAPAAVAKIDEYAAYKRTSPTDEVYGDATP